MFVLNDYQVLTVCPIYTKKNNHGDYEKQLKQQRSNYKRREIDCNQRMRKMMTLKQFSRPASYYHSLHFKAKPEEDDAKKIADNSLKMPWRAGKEKKDPCMTKRTNYNYIR